MKKGNLTIILSALLLLSGCSGNGAAQTAGTAAISTTTTVTTAAETTVATTAETTAATTAEERDPALDAELKELFQNLNIAAKSGKYLGETFDELYERYTKAIEDSGRSDDWAEMCREASALYDFTVSPAGKLLNEYGLWINNSDGDGKYYRDISRMIFNGLGDQLKEKIYTAGNSVTMPGLLWLPEEYEEYVSGGFSDIPIPRKAGGKLRVLLIDKSESVSSRKDRIGNFYYNSYTVSQIRETDWFDPEYRKDALESLRYRANEVFRALSFSENKPGFIIAATPSEADIILEFNCTDGTAQNYVSGSEQVTLWQPEIEITARSLTGQTFSTRFKYTTLPDQVEIPAGANRYGVIVAPLPPIVGTDEAQALADTLTAWFED